ncbi:hypothetical protein [Hydrocarboniphaga effusa]|uniref:Uncharacterized protein n=1 Tax=Hydrocarboniphaga effusa AP103 TaxID=1172194 RepID=I8T5S5_9GAMM|nr:hypothetical protein [Hydrocarboniphaga effusa]EIT69063.1 hypothetical protein WQQ_26450 [Hydrocarboniphaga effusa AP103]
MHTKGQHPHFLGGIRRRTLVKGGIAFLASGIAGCEDVSRGEGSDGPIEEGELRTATAVGTYTGNGTTVRTTVGFRPDFVLIVPLSDRPPSYVTHTTWNGRTSYFCETELGGGVTRPRGIVLLENGFEVGSLIDVNVDGVTYHWFAYKDNQRLALLNGDYYGSHPYDGPRTVELFKEQKLKAIILKRDNDPPAAHAFYELGGADYRGNAANAEINADGTFTVGTENIVNTGESCNVLAFPADSEDTIAFAYAGESQPRSLSLPWNPDAVLIMPLTPAPFRGGVWIEGMGSTYKPMSGSSVQPIGLKEVKNRTIQLSGDPNLNQSGVSYVCYAFRRSRNAIFVPERENYRTKNTIATQSTGYIDCGSDDSLVISGPITIEILCAHNQTDTTVFVGPDYNNEVGKQSPLIFRSNGPDADMGSVSFGLSVIAQWPITWAAGVPMPFASIAWAQSPIWQIWDHDVIPQQVCALMSGIGVAPHDLQHLLLTHNGHGKWKLYVNGSLVKDCNHDLSTDPSSGGAPPSNIQGVSGHRLIFGGRKREKDFIEQTNDLLFKEARIYSRELSPAEAFNNWLSIWENGPLPVSDFVEEWLADNAANGVLKATNSHLNDGQIIDGEVV